jgi:hypothetical protein
MLTHEQILHFRTFGFVTLRGLLSPAQAATLRQEVSNALTDAFGPVRAEPDEAGGISGDYLPLAVSRAPFSLALIADDPRTFHASAQLLGSPTVPSIGIATRFTGDSSWHTRQGPAIGGVTFWADLEPRTGQSGALRAIPGSHLPEFERRLCEYRAAEPASSGFADWPWPHVVVGTEPGDVTAFHPHLMTCARGGAPRLTWSIDYLPWPGLGQGDQASVVRDLTMDDVEFEHEDYDRDRWPVWRDWVAGAAGIRSREIAIERLRLLGVLQPSAGDQVTA